MMNDEKLMQQALEALEREINTRTCKTSTLRAMNALRARLARVGGTCKDCLQVEPSAEPVAWMNILEGGYKCLTSNPIPNWTPLYTAPPSYDDALERAARVCEELNLWNYDDPGESAAAAIRALIGKEPVAHADDIAVEKFAATMKAKLAEKRAQGYGGWDDTDECPADYLRQLLVKHVDKGDPVDVGNFAMMLWNRGERCAPTKESSNG